METIANKVTESGIITLDLTEHLPREKDIAPFDLKPFLFREMILREKDYRASLLIHDWAQYANKHVAIFCSTDAIIPMWAHMLAASYLQPVAASVFFGSEEELRKHLLLANLSFIDPKEYQDKRVVIKGCGDTPVPELAYVAITAKLRPYVKSLMYGEPCSTVPIFKKK
ncbi:MAG TPA: DUF2480 family protein [Flavipsychrobacter sp.]|nr:DUF2480 family protein [Flavipsychrobacter sp.]